MLPRPRAQSCSCSETTITFCWRHMLFSGTYFSHEDVSWHTEASTWPRCVINGRVTNDSQSTWQRGRVVTHRFLLEIDEGAGGDLSQEDQQEAGEVLRRGGVNTQSCRHSPWSSYLWTIDPWTHQAQQTADFVNGAHTAEESHEHGEHSNANQDVAGDLHSRRVVCARGLKKTKTNTLMKGRNQSAAGISAANTAVDQPPLRVATFLRGDAST